MWNKQVQRKCTPWKTGLTLHLHPKQATLIQCCKTSLYSNRIFVPPDKQITYCNTCGVVRKENTYEIPGENQRRRRKEMFLWLETLENVKLGPESGKKIKTASDILWLFIYSGLLSPCSGVWRAFSGFLHTCWGARMRVWAVQVIQGPCSRHFLLHLVPSLPCLALGDVGRTKARIKVLRVNSAEQLEASPNDGPGVPKSQLGDNLALTAFGCKLEVWKGEWAPSRRGGGIKVELCRQEWRSGLLGYCLALLNDDDNGSLWECIEVYLSMFAECFGILEQGAVEHMINGLFHTWLWWQTNSCSAVLEINYNILLIWSRFYTLDIHIFLNIAPVINY